VPLYNEKQIRILFSPIHPKQTWVLNHLDKKYVGLLKIGMDMRQCQIPLKKKNNVGDDSPRSRRAARSVLNSSNVLLRMLMPFE
jgi:hypothetical protein